MKVGDLVRVRNDNFFTTWGEVPPVDAAGLIIGWNGAEVVVYWGNSHGIEIEYPDHLEVTSEKG